MRILLLTCVLIVLPLAAWAGGTCRCDDGCTPDAMLSSAVDDCCKLITTACIRVKYTPRCDWPEHQCPMPLAPCENRICLKAPGHKPAVPYTPCGSYCIEPVCHKPAVAAVLCDSCAAPCAGESPQACECEE